MHTGHTHRYSYTHTDAATQQLQIQMRNALADTFALFTVRKLKAKAMQSKATLEWNIKQKGTRRGDREDSEKGRERREREERGERVCRVSTKSR